MKITPTPLTAALAGIFSALAWPPLWSHFGHTAAAGGIELILGTLVVVALPAHAFVVGFRPGQASGGRVLDTPLLKRVASWLLAGVAAALLAAAIRA